MHPQRRQSVFGAEQGRLGEAGLIEEIATAIAIQNVAEIQPQIGFEECRAAVDRLPINRLGAIQLGTHTKVLAALAAE